MRAETKVISPGFFRSLFRQKCPRCRTGDMFQTSKSYDLRRFMKMNEQCPACGQHMEIEPGFYYGTAYISYFLTVVLSGATFAAWALTIGFSLKDQRLFYWIGVNGLLLILFQPWLMRLSRAVWLGFFVKYDVNWAQPDPGEPGGGDNFGPVEASQTSLDQTVS